jgi:diguanylate cyclase (GGDEF)-like protein/PAS domain S-box-containing protein
MFSKYEQIPLILVTDDDTFLRSMLRNLLEEQGYAVIEAENGMQAIDVFESQHPDLILLDALMPVMDGFTACREICKLDQHETPIIMITSLDDEDSVDRAFNAGAVEYVTKPVHWAVLRHRVKVILQARWAEVALRRSEARFRGIFEYSAIGVALTDMQGHIQHVNPALQAILGQSELELHHRLFTKSFYPYDTMIEREYHQQLLACERDSYQMEKYFFRGDSLMLWGRITTSLIRTPEEEPLFIVQMVEDVTERKRSQAKQRLATKVFETTSDGIMITNAEAKIIDVNQAFLLTNGYCYEEILDQNPRILKSGNHDYSFYEEMWSQARETGRWRGEIWNKRKNNELYSTWMSLSAVRGEHNEITNYVAVYSDMGSQREDDRRNLSLTHYDPLTKLANRLLFHEQLTRACRQEQQVALLYLDLDDFKQINENFNFDIGDECLCIIAHKLKICLRDGDSVARVEGDEFAIILAPIHQEHEVRMIVEKILVQLAQPLNVQGQHIQIGLNIGISLCHESVTKANMDIETLIQQADMAMYLAKEQGKNTYFIYSADKELELD